MVARVAVLFASGVFAAYDLDQMGELWATHVTGTAAAARVGRATDIEWLQLPGPVGEQHHGWSVGVQGSGFAARKRRACADAPSRLLCACAPPFIPSLVFPQAGGLP